jgi:hypothetical protein
MFASPLVSFPDADAPLVLIAASFLAFRRELRPLLPEQEHRDPHADRNGRRRHEQTTPEHAGHQIMHGDTSNTIVMDR